MNDVIFNVLIESSGEDSWTKFLSYNTNQGGVAETYLHATNRTTDDATDAAVRITVGPATDDDEAFVGDELKAFLTTNW
jgi:hypothetical protein